MPKSYILFIYVFSSFILKAQTAENTLLLFIDESTIIARFDGNDVYTSDRTIGYTLQGNIVFQGNEKNTSDILLIINAKDILGKKAGIIYQNDSKTVEYITLNGNVFYGDYPIDEQNDKLLYFRKVSDSTIEVFSGLTDSLIGKIEGKPINAPRLALAAHLYIQYYELDQLVIRRLQELQNQTISTNGGTIQLAYTDDPYYRWIWDGKTLRPFLGNRPQAEWTFDGRYFKQPWNLDPRNEWVWENDILKPSWDNNVELQWIWENNTLRSFWAPIPEKTWIYEDGIIRPMWNYRPELEWEITGNVPLPVIALVVLGIADSR